MSGLPTGREVRRWTDLRRRTGATTSLADTLADVYMGALAAAMAFASAVYAVRGSALTAATAGGTGRVEPGWLGLLALLAALLAVVRLARRLGPVGLDPARVRWWLPLPVDRAGLIGPAAWRVPALAGVLAAALAAIAMVLLLGDATAVGADPGGPAAGDRPAAAVAPDGTTPAGTVPDGTVPDGTTPLGTDLAGTVPAGTVPVGPVLAASAAVGTVTAAACVWLIPSQVRTGRGRLLGVLQGGLVLVVGLGSGAVLLLAPAAPGVPPTWALLAVTGLGVAGLGVGLVAARRALERIPDAELARGGRVTGSAVGAVAMLDTRTLGSLGSGSSADTVARPARLTVLRVTPRPLRPAAALLAADLLATARRPALLLRPLLMVLTLLLVAELRGAPAWLLPATVGVGGYLAACSGATGAKAARVLEGLDAHLPMGARSHRVVRLAGSWLVQLPYMLGASLVLAGGSVVAAWPWLALLAVAGVGWAGAALRWAYRKDDTGTGPVAPSPFGPVPVGSMALLVTGADAAVVMAAPVALAVWTGAPLGLLLVITAVLAAVVAAWTTTPPPRD